MFWPPHLVSYPTGKYEDALRLENEFNEAIKGFEFPITTLCLYKAIPDNLEDRFLEYHDLIIKNCLRHKL